MAVTLKYRGSNPTPPSSAASPHRRGLLSRNVLRFVAIAILAVVVISIGVFVYFYNHYKSVVDERLASGPLFAPVTQIYAAPRELRPGQTFTTAQIAADLRRAGYGAGSLLGTYELHGTDSISIKPGPQSFHSTDGATVTTTGGPDTAKIQSIAAESGAPLAAYQLEPQLISSLSEDKSRTKRRLVTYAEIPPRLVQAVTAIEDRRFFEHGGVDYHRIAGAIYHDLFGHSRLTEGGSTITMQLARGFFLSPARTLQRKLSEILITFQLESRFSKQQIFDMYANQINLGQRGSFAVNGFGEAAQSFFGKDLKNLDTAQLATLAGLIQSPNRLNPYRHPERAIERRNLVLQVMQDTGDLTPAEARAAQAEPLHLAPQNVDASDAPYFVDLVHEQLSQRISDQEQAHASLRIYTSLDPDLQHAAADAVDLGMPHVDELVHKLDGPTAPLPQVALVALDPHTGQVLALVGGRNYANSQLNHATSKRPTGSIFKPWVYAAAFAASVNGQIFGDTGQPFTAATILNDTATTFTYDNGRKTYNPHNKLSGYKGDVTAAYALAHSLNNATVALGQQVGFGNVASLARASGITNAQGTPAVALGSYDAAPLDMAGAYTVFANGGVHLTPWLLSSVRSSTGDIVSDFPQQGQQVMDPRAAYLTQSLLEGVMTYGTAAAVRSRGFTAPAAGKTGTSHDVWFAGYTSNLLCIVWIGNDDYTNMGRVQGATAAAPIWAEFMKRAQKLPQYSDMRSFTAPSGIQIVRLDRASNLLADASCPDDYTAAFLDGTAPQNTCTTMNESPGSFVNRIFGNGPNSYADPNAPPNPNTITPDEPADNAATTNPDGTPKKKRGFFGRLFGTGNPKPAQPDPTQQQPPAPVVRRPPPPSPQQ